MELEKKYIYQVYVNGSFSKAAEALFVTQPALSIAIRKVEKAIGAALFHRGQRPLTLTPVGEMYISYIKKEMLLERLKKHFFLYSIRIPQDLEIIQSPCTGKFTVILSVIL